MTTAFQSGAFQSDAFQIRAGGSSVTYTFTVSGGVVFSGEAILSKIDIIEPNGNITFTGTSINSFINIVEPDGSLVFSGTNTLIFVPEGGALPSSKLPMTGAGIT